MRSIAGAERRARLGRRHWLAGRRRSGVGAQGPKAAVDLARDLCGLHATDPATVHLSAWARIASYEPDALGAALYDEHTAIRMLAMRRTMFVLPTDLVPTIHQACSAKVGATNRRRLEKLLETNDIAEDGAGWLADVEGKVLAALAENGEAQAGELAAAVPQLKQKVDMAPGKSYGGEVALTNQVLTHLAVEGRIVRGRPVGGWTSTRYRWARLDGFADADLESIDAAAAEAELCRRWLAVFGPATEADVRWWTGWTATQARGAVAAVAAEEVRLADGTGYVLPEDADAVDAPEPWIALLPALDPTAMGWKGRDFYLGDHASTLFDRYGNIGPTIWSDGRIVGGWAQRADGEVGTHLLEDIGSERTSAVHKRASELTTWLGDVKVTPRFRTPLETELAAS